MLCLLIQGCVGIGVSKTRNEAFQNPKISDVAYVSGLSHTDASQTNVVVYTATWLENHWGRPARITHVGVDSQTEVWTYKFDIIWNGVTPVLLVPIPIILPVGREQIQFVLQDGRVVSAKEHKEQSFGGAYGLSAALHDKFWTLFLGRLSGT
ncbi:hypothetical protein Cflav_PD4191 [Pedosphaera parvula Ellin514]|uniref:Uncharacterized protein n=2 Tax=Pedosphaera TaxID=1032526 RepID=B9XF15_PEDPL|nr:hypothetical protein Cflav_PD4191 [Pedosphaera parvula Ellin514]